MIEFGSPFEVAAANIKDACRRILLPAANLAICPQCGYPLCGLPRDGRCPECGLSYDGASLLLEGFSIDLVNAANQRWSPLLILWGIGAAVAAFLAIGIVMDPIYFLRFVGGNWVGVLGVAGVILFVMVFLLSAPRRVLSISSRILILPDGFGLYDGTTPWHRFHNWLIPWSAVDRVLIERIRLDWYRLRIGNAGVRDGELRRTYIDVGIHYDDRAASAIHDAIERRIHAKRHLPDGDIDE